MVDKSQLLEFSKIKEELIKKFSEINHFNSELELRLLLKKKEKLIVVFNNKKEVPYDLISKIVLVDIKNIFKEIFHNLDCEVVLRFPNEIYQKIFTKYCKIKDNLYDKMSESDTHKFILNLLPEDYIQKRQKILSFKRELTDFAEKNIKDTDWGNISAKLGELLYYLHDLCYDDNIEQIKSRLNQKFVTFIENEYENLIYNPKSLINFNLINLIFSHQENKNAIICFDCMGFEEWNVIKEYLGDKQGIDYKTNYSLALLPSETKYSSSAIFSGMPPKDIKKLEFIKEIHWKYEEKLFKYILNERFSIKENDIYFKRCLISKEINFSYNNFLDYKNIGLVFSFIDDISHSRRSMNKRLLLQNIKFDLEHSNLYDLINELLQQDFNVYIVSDHGSIFSNGNGLNVSKELFDIKAKRYLITDNKMLLNEYKTKTKNSILIQFKNIIGNEYLLLLSHNEMFGSRNESGLTHGGISIEEVVVPFIKVIRK